MYNENTTRARGTVAIVNPNAAGGRVSARFAALRSRLETRFGPIEAHETRDPAAASRVVRRALDHGAGTVLAVGGDGTVNGVVNGFFDGARPVAPQSVLALVPVGTGNDTARSMGLHARDPVEALATASVRSIDVGHLSLEGPAGRQTRVFLNTASFGLGTDVARAVGGTAKRVLGPFAYWAAVARVLLSRPVYEVRIRTDGGAWGPPRPVTTVTIGNGRFVGGGMQIAPGAGLDDGVFDLVIIDRVGLGTFVRHGGRLREGTHGDLPFVSIAKATRVEAVPARAGGMIPADVEGEPAGTLPLTASVLPGALRVLAPWADAVGVS